MYLFRFPRMPHIIRFSHSVCLLFYAFTDQWREMYCIISVYVYWVLYWLKFFVYHDCLEHMGEKYICKRKTGIVCDNDRQIDRVADG